MRIRYGFNIEIDVPQDVTILTAMDVEPRRRRDIVYERPFAAPTVASVENYSDAFGNLCRRIECPPGAISLSLEGIIHDSGKPDPVAADAPQIPVARLPVETLPFLLASRYCETEFLTDIAWAQFGGIQGGWDRVQAICDFVHDRLTFGYPHARPTRTALEAYNERVGVCRDFTHLAVALCRCMNIPARYCNGYLGDIGVPPDPAPMDFNAWFEAYIGGGWYTFDARHNMPRIGRIIVARGRDAMDIPMLHTFGPHYLRRFEVITEELRDAAYDIAAE
ncbi:MAG: transglutaminase [Rhodospirillales bacterium]|nr:transglutaminase [Rhodospirillales bacterium]